MDRINFLKTFIKDIKVGAVTQTSRFAVQKVCSKIDFGRDISIVEYGPGDGVFTRHLLEKLSPNSRLIAIDRNKYFLDCLQEYPDERLSAVEGDVRLVKTIIGNEGLNKADYVISGIPFTFHTPAARYSIVKNTYDVLKPGGFFLIYQYSPLMKRYTEQIFDSTEMLFEPFNIPSVFIICAQKTKPHTA